MSETTRNPDGTLARLGVERSFDNYEKNSGRKLKFYGKWKLRHRTNYNSSARFLILEKRFCVSNFAVLKWTNFLVNLQPVMFERFLAGIFPPQEVIFKLQVSKPASRA